MTTNSGYAAEQNFSSEEDLEPSKGNQALSTVVQIFSQLKRMVVFVPIFGVVFLAIGFLWFQDVKSENSFNSQSESLRARLDQPSPQPDLLLQEADGWDAAYQVVLDKRTARPTDSDLIGLTIDAAQLAGMVVVETGTTDDGEVTLQNEKYTVTPILLKANGTLAGIKRFLEILETPDFASFEIQSSLVNSEAVGYQITLKGIFYSLPETFGDGISSESPDQKVIPITAVETEEVAR